MSTEAPLLRLLPKLIAQRTLVAGTLFADLEERPDFQSTRDFGAIEECDLQLLLAFVEAATPGRTFRITDLPNFRPTLDLQQAKRAAFRWWKCSVYFKNKSEPGCIHFRRVGFVTNIVVDDEFSVSLDPALLDHCCAAGSENDAQLTWWATRLLGEA